MTVETVVPRRHASKRHSRLVRLLSNALDTAFGPDWNADSGIEIRLQDTPPSNRRPDVTVYRADVHDVSPTRPQHVLLVVEVNSPEAETADQYARAAAGAALVHQFVRDPATGHYRGSDSQI
jgi:Uma2 family endonuclease